jgi:Fe-Mn family superoxide dismutase
VFPDIDYRNLRPKYVEAFWNLVNWKFVAEQFEGKSFTA